MQAESEQHPTTLPMNTPDTAAPNQTNTVLVNQDLIQNNYSLL